VTVTKVDGRQSAQICRANQSSPFYQVGRFHSGLRMGCLIGGRGGGSGGKSNQKKIEKKHMLI
jgi:hypothetical protein